MTLETSFSRLKKIKTAKSRFENIFQQKKNVLLIHYSCESFVENTKGSHKITSIAVRNLDTGQTRSFSIFQCAEELGISDIDKNFERIEKKLLEDFFEFVQKRENYLWVHWNMRDINYGFTAIEHRFKALGGTPTIIPDDSKFDLPRILYERFSKTYASHPRLVNLVKMNKITNKNFLPGAEEADAFNAGEYLKLHQSTLRKVDVFDCILSRIEDNNLVVGSSFFEIYGLGWGSITKRINDHWIMSLILFLVAIAGILIFIIEWT